MLGFRAKKKENMAVRNWHSRARWIDLRKTKVIIIDAGTQDLFEMSATVDTAGSPKTDVRTAEVPKTEDRTGTRAETSGTSVSFKPLSD